MSWSVVVKKINVTYACLNLVFFSQTFILFLSFFHQLVVVVTSSNRTTFPTRNLSNKTTTAIKENGIYHCLHSLASLCCPNLIIKFSLLFKVMNRCFVRVRYPYTLLFLFFYQIIGYPSCAKEFKIFF